MRKVVTVRHHPDGRDMRAAPRRSFDDSTNFELGSVRTGLARLRVPVAAKVQQDVSEELPAVDGKT